MINQLKISEAVQSILDKLDDNQKKQVIQSILRNDGRNGMWRGGYEPPDFEDFVYLLTYEPNIPGSGIILSDRQKQLFQKFGRNTAESIVSENNKPTELVTMWGKGSGKDTMSALYISYLCYVCLSLKGDVASRFGLYPGTPLAILNVAPNEETAKQVFFKYLSGFIKRPLFAPWMKNPRTQILSDQIKFPNINLVLYSKHSRASGLDGYNLIAWVMDEADAFMDEGRHNNANTIHQILRSSSISRMRNRWVGIVISYPRSPDGFMMKLVNTAMQDIEKYGENAHYVVDIGSSFDVNPRISRNDPGIISDYETDPQAAKAMYECDPQSVKDAFFEYQSKIDMAIDKNRLPCVDVVIDNPIMRESGSGDLMEFVGCHIEAIRPERGRTYFIGVDAGVVGDAYAISMFSTDDMGDIPEWICPDCYRMGDFKSDYEQAISVGYERQPICGICLETAGVRSKTFGSKWWRRKSGNAKTVVIDGISVDVTPIREECLIHIQPVKTMGNNRYGRPVDLISVRALIAKLIQNFNPAGVMFDPWQSYSMIQDLRNECGGNITDISFSQMEQYKRARLVKSLLYGDCIRLLPNERRDKEWKNLIRNGYKIDHPIGGSKDLYDAESIAIYQCAKWKGLESIAGNIIMETSYASAGYQMKTY